MESQKDADRIRQYLKQQYLDTARLRGVTIVRIVAGDIHKELGLSNRVPNVCQVLKSKKFLKENRLVLEKLEGPPSGLSTTATYTYRLEAAGPPAPKRDSLLLSLRGIAKDTFASLGGGEKFIHGERENFYRREDNR
jgi:5-methylcytosine-specific restriction protein B